MLYVCVRGVMDVGFFVCIVTCGAVGAHVWEVCIICPIHQLVCLGSYQITL